MILTIAKLFCRFFTPSAKYLIVTKSMQNPSVSHYDLMVGPMLAPDRNLAQSLHLRSKWCYLNRCLNNIYYTFNETMIHQANLDDSVLKYIEKEFENEIYFQM